MKIVYLLLALFQYLILNSQNYGDVWIIGYDRDSTTWPKYGKTILDFSNGKLETNYTFAKSGQIDHLRPLQIDHLNMAPNNHQNCWRRFHYS